MKESCCTCITRLKREGSVHGSSDKPKILYLPYIQHITEPIQRVCRKLGVKVVFRTPQTLRQQLVRLKTARPKLKKKNVIYKVPCLDCTSVYIGETGRCLQVRLTEHKAAVRRGDRKNGIATHAWDHNHRVNWEGAQVIQTEPFYWKRRVLEAIIIRNHDTTSNLDCGLSLDPHSFWEFSFCLSVCMHAYSEL